MSDEELVRAFFTTFSSGDLDRVATFSDADSTWTVCATEIPGAGTHRGRDEIVEELLGREYMDSHCVAMLAP